MCRSSTFDDVGLNQGGELGAFGRASSGKRAASARQTSRDNEMMKLASALLAILAPALSNASYVFTVWHDTDGATASACAAPATNAVTIEMPTDGECVQTNQAFEDLASAFLAPGDVWVGWSGSNWNMANSKAGCEASFSYSFSASGCQNMMSSAGPGADQEVYFEVSVPSPRQPPSPPPPSPSPPPPSPHRQARKTREAVAPSLSGLSPASLALSPFSALATR